MTKTIKGTILTESIKVVIVVTILLLLRMLWS